MSGTCMAVMSCLHWQYQMYSKRDRVSEAKKNRSSVILVTPYHSIGAVKAADAIEMILSHGHIAGGAIKVKESRRYIQV